MERIYSKRPARITFTRDFHELVRGGLRPGAPFLVRYGPARIVPPGHPYVFGDPNAPIVAHAMFREGGAAVARTLISEAGILEHPAVDVTGDGSMLTATFDCPEGAEDVRIWFSFTSPAGGFFYDSDYGRNFRFGFTTLEFRLTAAAVDADAAGNASVFTAQVATIAAVQRVTIRLREVGYSGVGAKDVELTRDNAGPNAEGWTAWTTPPIAVTRGAVIRFKFYYWLRSVAYKDDNNGRYYLAPRPETQRSSSEPPKELAAASRAWAPRAADKA